MNVIKRHTERNNFFLNWNQFELRCAGCPESRSGDSIACSRCYYDQMNPTIDPVYQNSVKPLMWLCAAILPSVGVKHKRETVYLIWHVPVLDVGIRCRHRIQFAYPRRYGLEKGKPASLVVLPKADARAHHFTPYSPSKFSSLRFFRTNAVQITDLKWYKGVIIFVDSASNNT